MKTTDITPPDYRTIEKLTAENARLREDAQRYRWLRDTPWPDDLHRIITLHQNALFDAAIDAARKKE